MGGNNASISLPVTEIADITWDDWHRVGAVNLDGGLFLIAQGAFGMTRAQLPRVGSVPYTMTKTAITGLTRNLSRDGRKHGTALSQIGIGNAASDLTDAMTKGVPQADGSLKPEPVMDVAHVARAVLQLAALPLEANVPCMTIRATKMPYAGRG